MKVAAVVLCAVGLLVYGYFIMEKIDFFLWDNKVKKRHTRRLAQDEMWKSRTFYGKIGKIILSIKERIMKNNFIYSTPNRMVDLVKMVLLLLAATGVGYVFWYGELKDASIIAIYILTVLLISLVTNNWVYSLISSLLSVFVFNFFFTEPRFSFFVYTKDYVITFAVMFTVAFITGSLAAKLKSHAERSARMAYHTNILYETDQLLGRASNADQVIRVTANQLIKLLGRDVAIYPAQNGVLLSPYLYTEGEDSVRQQEFMEQERDIAQWVFNNNHCAGAGTAMYGDAKYVYYAIRIDNTIYGVVGVFMEEDQFDQFENNILLSILGECALALENEKNAREKEEAAVLAQNERLRTNLLRSISHDLRTPLTSISGNASNLISNGDKFDQTTKNRLYRDIYDESMWLINLVENLLSITRIEDGKMQVNMSVELMEEVIAEALKHINRLSSNYKVQVDCEDLLLAKMDARLIVQVIINIVDNAIKYTPKGSCIHVSAFKRKEMVVVCIADNGPGIDHVSQQHVFDMFYTGSTKIADSRRSLGLGLFLCKAIIDAHGGNITVYDNKPHGAVFEFEIPAEEVSVDE